MKTPLRAIRVPDDEWRAAQRQAREDGVNLTQVIRDALRRYARRDDRHN